MNAEKKIGYMYASVDADVLAIILKSQKIETYYNSLTDEVTVSIDGEPVTNPEFAMRIEHEIFRLLTHVLPEKEEEGEESTGKWWVGHYTLMMAKLKKFVDERGVVQTTLYEITGKVATLKMFSPYTGGWERWCLISNP